MAKESLEPIALEQTDGGGLRRHSTGNSSSSNTRQHAPHYLRASTGSRHDLCKYGKHVAEEGQPLAEKKKNIPTMSKSKPKPKPLPDVASRTRSRPGLPDVNEIHKSRTRAIKQEVPSSDRARLSAKSTSKAVGNNNNTVGMKTVHTTSARPFPGRVATSKPNKPRIPKTVSPPNNENTTKKSVVKQRDQDEAQEKILCVIAMETQNPPSESDQHQYVTYGEENILEDSDYHMAKKPTNVRSEEEIVEENRKINADGVRRSYKQRQVEGEAKGGSEQVVLRHQDVEEKKNAKGLLLNKVIEEAASKLGGTQKSKVKALVGAFETVISLQDRKPYATTVN